MDQVQLGGSHLHVSRICLGTMTWGEQNTEADAHSQLDYAVERGINFIDTAEMYPAPSRAETQGTSERHLGSWLKKTGRRDKMVIATKAAGPNASVTWVRGGRARNFDAANLRAAVETSLRRLQIEHIDLYQLHWPSRNVPVFGNNVFLPKRERASVPIEDTLSALGDLIKEGKIGAIGISNESNWGVSEFIKQSELKGLPRIATIQNLYNLSARGFETSLLDETCYRDNVSLLAYSPLAFGQLTGKYLDNPKAHGRLSLFPPTWSPRYLRPATVAAAARYAQLAREHGLTPTQLALAWCYSRWFVAATIIGATSLEQLQHNIDAYSIRLPLDLIKQIDQIHATITNPGQ
ncbi:aldo/keto reductase [Duganella sp. FT80W]|uniref:Aldo/keto reductase n=1 Tax=Duganella guangzhouensis TaxID=2666084 RepID=A0A6I2L371_9BURK|nr:aldo/keto reductase [Duganella guangzhouensis]MRW92170.1 aldo/keto reductase [Duganella guangzhouensis]